MIRRRKYRTFNIYSTELVASLPTHSPRGRPRVRWSHLYKGFKLTISKIVRLFGCFIHHLEPVSYLLLYFSCFIILRNMY